MNSSNENGKRARVGLVGLGGHGGTMQRACDWASNIEVAAVFDTDREEAALAASYFDCYHAVSYEALIRREDLDAVLLITPNYLHRKQVIAALDADLHVFVEKPLALNLDEGVEMISRAEAKGLVLMVGHNMRFWPGARRAKEYLADGMLGQLISVELHFSSPTGIHLPVDSWRRKPELCALPPVTQLAIHGFDLVHYLVGYIDTVTTHTRSAITRDEVVDSASAMFKMEDGALGVMVSNYCTPELFELRLSGTGGQMRINPRGFWFRELDPSTGELSPAIEEIDESNGFDSYTLIVEAFGKAVIEQTIPETDGWVGLQALSVVEAMQRSAAAESTPWVVERFNSTSLENNGASAEVI